jgi:uncharacterized protein YdhG (YjbR/CyaY superfamily)
MKKPKASARASAPKTTISPTTVDSYLAAVPEPARTTLSKVRATIRSVVPKQATEAISYGIPSFKYKGSLVWYAAFSKHCSFFPGSKAVLKMFASELDSFPTSKGTIQFPLDKPLPASLVKKMVQARLAEKNDKKPH